MKIGHDINHIGVARGVVGIVAGNGHDGTSSNLGMRLIFISHGTHTLWKGMNRIFLHPAMGK